MQLSELFSSLKYAPTHEWFKRPLLALGLRSGRAKMRRLHTQVSSREIRVKRRKVLWLRLRLKLQGRFGDGVSFLQGR